MAGITGSRQDERSSGEPGIGCHLLADLFGVDAALLADAGLLRQLLHEAVARSGLRAVSEPVIVSFQPGAGVTGFVVLAESHIAFHSYPERGYLAVDIFTCGPHADPDAALEAVADRLRPVRTEAHRYVRGRALNE
jgi:S-adenosylmethionine decarboxylase proenzyme